MINGNRTKSTRGRSPRDFYKTPLDLAEAAITQLRHDEGLGNHYGIDALDAGCGDGIWGIAGRGLWYAGQEGNDDPCIDGIDIHPKVKSWDGFYSTVYCNDYITHNFGNKRYDLVFGNPPYSLAEEFIRKSFIILDEDGGYVYFLLRLSFLEGIARGRGLFKEFPIKRVYVCSRRPSFFSSDGKRHTTDTLAYAMFLWQKGYNGKTELDFLDWDYK